MRTTDFTDYTDLESVVELCVLTYMVSVLTVNMNLILSTVIPQDFIIEGEKAGWC